MGRGSGKKQLKRLEELAKDAEVDQRCIVPSDRNESILMRKKTADDTLVMPFPGLYLRKEFAEGQTPADITLLVMHTLAELHPGWVFRQASAAIAHGLEVPLADVSKVQVLIDQNCHTKSTDSVIRSSRNAKEITPVKASGVKVTPLDQTVVDCLSELDFPRALGVADSYLRRTKSGQRALRELIENSKLNATRRAAALEVASWADPLSENGGESFARGVMIELGFEAPQLQVTIPEEIDGTFPRVDYYWLTEDGVVIVGELDGKEKYYKPGMTDGKTVAEVMSEERIRESRISLTNAKVMRFTFAQVLNKAYFEHLLSEAGVPYRTE